MTRSTPIRRSLLISLVLIILVTGGSIFVTTIIGARLIARTVIESLISRSIDLGEERLRRFFDPAVQSLLLAERWSASGLIDLDDPEQTDKALAPILEQVPQISSIIIADERGREHMILREEGQWTRRRVDVVRWGATARMTEWATDDPTPRTSNRTIEYDPRTRPWFEGAVARRAALIQSGVEPSHAGLLNWTPPYVFFTTGAHGMTASRTITAADGSPLVVACDIHLLDVSLFTTSMRITANGGMMVLSDDGRVAGLPYHPRYSEPERQKADLLSRPDELGWELATDSAAAFYAQPASESGPIRFRSGGAPWWGEARNFPLSSQRALIIAVVVPESDILSRLDTVRFIIIGIIIAALAVVVMRAAALAKRFSRPIEELVRGSDRISEGDFEPGAPIVSSVREVQALTAAQERMRVGLQSLTHLERELELARKIQTSTFPDTLPDIDGYDLMAWSEPAAHTGGDTYDVIGRFGDDDRASGALLLLADATGHGVGPALSVTQICSMLRMASRLDADLVSIARHLNEQLCQDLPSGRFITAWLGELDAQRHELQMLSAGQAPLLHYRAAADEVVTFDADDIPFGIQPDVELSHPRSIGLEPSDFFIVLSDGLFEAASPNGKLMGTQRVIEIVRAMRAASAEDLLGAIREGVAAHTEGTPAEDDQTAVILKRVE